MRRRPGAPRLGAPLGHRDGFLSETCHPFTLVPGHRARSLPCYVCDRAAGGEPVYMMAVLTSVVCPADGVHLLAGAHLRHARCARPPDEELMPKLAELILPDEQ